MLETRILLYAFITLVAIAHLFMCIMFILLCRVFIGSWNDPERPSWSLTKIAEVDHSLGTGMPTLKPSFHNLI